MIHSAVPKVAATFRHMPNQVRSVVGCVFLVLLAIGRIEPPVAIILVVACLVFLAALRSTSLALACILLTVPVQDAAALQIGGGTLTWTKIVVAAAVFTWSLRVLADRSILRLDPLSAAFTACVAALAASVINTVDQWAWSGEVYRWGIALIVYLLAISGARERQFPVFLLAAVSIATIGSGLVAAGQVLTGYGPPSFEAHGISRAFGAFGEPNPLAGYLEMSVPLLFAFLVGAVRSVDSPDTLLAGTRFRRLVVVATVSGALALALTQSRGGLLGFSVGIAVISILAGGWPRKIVFVGAVLATAFIATPVGLRTIHANLSTTSNQLVTPSNFSVAERIAHWRTGLAMAGAYPVFGVGAGNFTDRYREFAQVWRFRISRGHAHNTYIHAMAQSGLIGLACYLALLGVAFWRHARAFQRNGWQTNGALAAGALGVTAAVAVHGLFDYLHVLSLGLQLSAVWAVASLNCTWRDGVQD